MRMRPSTAVCLVLLLLAAGADARSPIRRAFFSTYPSATGTILDDAPGNAGHCGVCHFDFDGGGPRNPYGVAVEVGVLSGLGDAAAILAVGAEDSDNDGFANETEILDAAHFGNTPTLPGLEAENLPLASAVDPAGIVERLTPSAGDDVTPPAVTVLAPAGGESLPCNEDFPVRWEASDASGVVAVDLDLSHDGGQSWRPAARGLDPDEDHAWYVPNRPGSARLRVTARDAAGNPGAAESGDFVVEPWEYGRIASTLRDFDLPGTQPHTGVVLDDAARTCAVCHAGYDADAEPWFNWVGSMMGQTLRDPLFEASLVIAEQDAPASGDLCLRCHAPGGWQEGRSVDTTGELLDDKDDLGVQCDFCHRLVDPMYVSGTSPAADAEILADLDAAPGACGEGQFVTDPDPWRRGPYADPDAAHQFLDSAFHRDADLCGTCHDVSNPMFVRGAAPGEYVPHELDVAHPDGDKRDLFPVERTFSEWSVSDYADVGVYAPQFTGEKPDGVASVCQDCHMPDATGRGAASGPIRSDLGVHHLTGGNHFMPDLIPGWFPGVDPAPLAAGKARAVSLLGRAATLELFESPLGGGPGVTVRIINETGHKLPSGYPEGRRMFLNVRAWDADDRLIYESCAYDPDSGVLARDADARVYEIKPGISARLAVALDLEPGPSFHFALNDTVYMDNRIPPRGATLAELEAVQSPVVGHDYPDGRYWDEAVYALPVGAVRAAAELRYQSTSLEYVTFLRDENVTNSVGQELYDAWVAHGRCAPVTMAAAELDLTSTSAGGPPRRTVLGPPVPNPFNPSTRLAFSLARGGQARLRVYDERGRCVRTLYRGALAAGEYVAGWDGRDAEGRPLSSGVYFAVLRTADERLLRKMTLLK